MNNKKDIQQLIEDFIQKERDTTSNPFLSTRIMTAIEQKRSNKLVIVSPVWRTAVIAFSLMVAVFTGIEAGNLYHTKNDATSVILMNDNRMENFSLYNEIGNE